MDLSEKPQTQEELKNAPEQNTEDELNTQAEAVAENLTKLQKSGTMHGEILEALKKVEGPETLRTELAQKSIADIRFDRVFSQDNPNTKPEDRIQNTREETQKRLAAYSSAQDNEWFTLDYKKVGGMKHEMNIGLGDILIDPTIKNVLIEKNGRYIYAERKAGKENRIGFYDQASNQYVSTFTGDKFRILSDKEAEEGYQDKYIAALDEENAYRKSQKEAFANNEIESKAVVSEVLKALNMPEDKEPKNSALIAKLQNMDYQDLLKFKHDIGPQALKDFFSITGLDMFTAREELKSEISSQIEALEANDTLLKNINGIKNKADLKAIIYKLAAHESGFRPFLLSPTYAMGYFQFTDASLQSIEKNPFKAKDAVAGQLEYLRGNLKTLGDTASLKELIISHNRGAGFVNENRDKLDEVGKDRYGNPAPEDFFAMVNNLNPEDPKYQNTQFDREAIVSGYYIKSAPYEHSGTSTLCSRTAARNLANLGVDTPQIRSGNAIDVERSYINDPQKIIGVKNIDIATGLNSKFAGATVADIFVESQSPYGHRAVAYKRANKWLVLDPYRNHQREGVAMEAYNGRIKFAVPLALANAPSA